jgi:hypothetical protein
VLEWLAGSYRELGWPAQVEGDGFTAPFSAPSAGPPPWHLYRFTPDTVFGVASAEPYGATRWRFENEFYVATRNYLFQFDATTWGWIHLILGLVVAFAGWGLLSGQTWARVVAITLAVLSAIANFLWLPSYPFWSMLIIAVDIFVIWAVAAHGREVAA